MGYMHIDNLYKDDSILAYAECWAMEKIHGTSAHVVFRRVSLGTSMVDGHADEIAVVEYFPGGVKRDAFVALFRDVEAAMAAKFLEQGLGELVVYGEAYGGNCQGMSKTYGKDLRFVAFEAKVDGAWYDVDMAAWVAGKMGFEFVHFARIPCTMAEINAQRDADSVQAVRNGMGPGHMREGVVLRPLREAVKPNGNRVIAKHKRPEFCETASKREAGPTKRQAMDDAQAIAEEWVTRERVNHVIDALISDAKFPASEEGDFRVGIESTGLVIKAVVEDVVREAGAEIMDTKESRKAIGGRAAMLYKAIVQERASVCRACGGSGQEPKAEHFVSAEMASDAGQPERAGESMGVEYGPCSECGGTGLLPRPTGV